MVAFTIFEKLNDVNLINHFLIFFIQINHVFSKYVLQSLQGHFRGTHFLIFPLKVLRVSDFFFFGKFLKLKKSLSV